MKEAGVDLSIALPVLTKPTQFESVMNYAKEINEPFFLYINKPELKYVDEEITSPEKTQEEVDYLRNALPELTGLEKELQDDCDIVRLNHLKYYGELLEEYKIKTGHYPFQENSQTQIYAFIYNNIQKEYASDTNPNKHILILVLKIV